ncbi:MAG: peptidoglycan-binding protein [Desulfobacteraceae bacterium]|nr:peptidoglycan-binding protein [Desulfobacteraceae bacterium]
MKNKKIFFLSLLLVILLCACRTLPTSSTNKKQSPAKSTKIYFADPEKMDSDANLALATIDAAKLGFLEFFPLVRTNPQTKINLENKTDYIHFKQRNIVIAEDTKSPEGYSTLGMVCESIDSLGRIDLSKNQIIFRITEPDKKEVDAIKKSLLQGSKISKQIKDSQLSNYLKKKISEYQRAQGLTSDGIAGKKTIEYLSKKLSMIDVQELTTQVLYPNRPRLSVYIMRSETFESNQDKFNKGFKSIGKVQKHALSMKEFKSFAKPGEEFIVFIYFLDRVDPAHALKWNLSTTKKSSSKPMSKIFYVEPATWPVIVQTFSVDKKTKSSKLYINLFTTRKRSTTCIASYEIK